MTVIDATNNIERARGGGAMNADAEIAVRTQRIDLRAFNCWPENFADPRSRVSC
jgi:hypothetical protein